MGFLPSIIYGIYLHLGNNAMLCSIFASMQILSVIIIIIGHSPCHMPRNAHSFSKTDSALLTVREFIEGSCAAYVIFPWSITRA